MSKHFIALFEILDVRADFFDDAGSIEPEGCWPGGYEHAVFPLYHSIVNGGMMVRVEMDKRTSSSSRLG